MRIYLLTCISLVILIKLPIKFQPNSLSAYQVISLGAGHVLGTSHVHQMSENTSQNTVENDDDCWPTHVAVFVNSHWNVSHCTILIQQVHEVGHQYRAMYGSDGSFNPTGFIPGSNYSTTALESGENFAWYFRRVGVIGAFFTAFY